MSPHPKAPAIRGVLFDKDGTLLDFRATWLPISKRCCLVAARGDQALADALLAAGGYDADTDIVRPDTPLACGTTEELVQSWLGALPWPAPQGLDEELTAMLLDETGGRPVPVTDLPHLFGLLRARGLALGVATMDSGAAARAGLETLGVLHLMDFVVGFDDGKGHKPEPGMILAFAEQVGLRPEQVAMVGDAVRDLKMGRNAGAGLAIGVLTGPASREHLSPHGDVVVDSIADLERLLAT